MSHLEIVYFNLVKQEQNKKDRKRKNDYSHTSRLKTLEMIKFLLGSNLSQFQSCKVKVAPIWNTY